MAPYRWTSLRCKSWLRMITLCLCKRSAAAHQTCQGPLHWLTHMLTSWLSSSPKTFSKTMRQWTIKTNQALTFPTLRMRWSLQRLNRQWVNLSNSRMLFLFSPKLPSKACQKRRQLFNRRKESRHLVLVWYLTRCLIEQKDTSQNLWLHSSLTWGD